jgi:hypothetical protein
MEKQKNQMNTSLLKKNLIAKVKNMGSTAQTINGLCSYWLKEIQSGKTKLTFRSATNQYHPLRFSYIQQEKRRTSNPDIKRAKHDSTFRKSFVAKIKRQANKLAVVPLATIEQVNSAAKTYNHRSSKIKELQNKLECIGSKILLPTPQSIKTLPIQRLKITTKDEKSCKNLLNLAKRQWSINSGFYTKIIVDQDNVSTFKNGSYRTVTRADHRAQFTCFAFLENNKTLASMIGEKVTRTIAPEGFEFKKDENGIYLCRLSDGIDYHPSSEEIRNYSADQMIPILNSNAEIRLKQKIHEETILREKELFIKDLPTTRVTLNDSRKAGNCVEGSLRFAERFLHISRDIILNSNHLFSTCAKKLVDSGNPLAINAAKQAWLRETTIAI